MLTLFSSFFPSLFHHFIFISVEFEGGGGRVWREGICFGEKKIPQAFDNAKYS